MKKWALPGFLGAITFALLIMLLMPSDPPRVKVVVAARDLGAGMVLEAADLAVKEVRKDEVPEGAISDPNALIGKTLAVIRFKGDIITLQHIGPHVRIAPDERAIAVKVTLDRGLAGLLRPGMQVGIIATLELENSIYAKATLEGFKVLYIPPDFIARPPEELAKVQEQQGGILQTPVFPAQARIANEGVVVLSAPTRPQTVIYVTENMTREITVTPLELIAALNAQGQAVTLYLVPEGAEPFTSAGVRLLDLVPEALRPIERRVVYESYKGGGK